MKAEETIGKELCAFVWMGGDKFNLYLEDGVCVSIMMNASIWRITKNGKVSFSSKDRMTDKKQDALRDLLEGTTKTVSSVTQNDFGDTTIKLSSNDGKCSEVVTIEVFALKDDLPTVIVERR